VSGAQVAAGAANGRTDGRGWFRLDGVAAGRVRVTASDGARHAADEVEVRADDESRVELTLR
jgi:Carboxypeptidase regulatory-like domain